MKLRRISDHIKTQNWFAVGLDFLIVVVGILLAFQITTWNEVRHNKARESAVLQQLEEEFTEIHSAIKTQITFRRQYVENIGLLIEFLEDGDSALDDLKIKAALNSLKATGRRPAQSAAYLQLMASGELAMLSNEDLQKALVRYDARLERDAFIQPELMKLVIEELSSNSFVDYDVSAIRGGASIDNAENDDQPEDVVRSYDLEGLRGFVKRYEAIYILHLTILDSEEAQIEFATEILNQISRENG